MMKATGQKNEGACFQHFKMKKKINPKPVIGRVAKSMEVSFSSVIYLLAKNYGKC